MYPNPYGIVAAASGAITEFIGASFLVMYKSTVTQAKDYVTVLERINAAGMALQVLETVAKHDKPASNQARIEIAKELERVPKL